MREFQIVTTSGDTYTSGCETHFAFLDAKATLQSYGPTSDGYLSLAFSGDITVRIPEAQVRHIVTGPNS
jgi:hypothetical protein